MPIAHLVVRDRVEEVVVARVEHGVAHAAEDSKHGTTAVLDLNVEGTVTCVELLPLLVRFLFILL